MPAEVLNFTDDVVSLLIANFAAAGKAAEITREYEIQHDLGKFTGLKVNVFPVSYVRDSPATRKEDNFDTECVMVIAERFTNPGPPSKAWLDERVNMVDQLIYVPFAKITHPLTNGYWLQEIDVTTVYDLKMLRQQKVFWSEVELTFRKLRE